MTWESGMTLELQEALGCRAVMCQCSQQRRSMKQGRSKHRNNKSHLSRYRKKPRAIDCNKHRKISISIQLSKTILRDILKRLHIYKALTRNIGAPILVCRRETNSQNNFIVENVTREGNKDEMGFTVVPYRPSKCIRRSEP